ncbi:MAG: restriction endonuclease-like protein [Phycisphaerales bacterium]|nr:restriction endonuclease-like protein [Phycisphaerales bacterium]
MLPTELAEAVSPARRITVESDDMPRIVLASDWKTRFPVGVKLRGTPKEVDSFGCHVELEPGLLGVLSERHVRTLELLGMFRIADPIDVVIRLWDDYLRRPLLMLPPSLDVQGTIDSIEFRFSRKGQKLRQFVNVQIESLGVIPCYSRDLYVSKGRFPPGRSVQVAIDLNHQLMRDKHIVGSIVLSENQDGWYSQAPRIGSIISAVVVKQLGFGAICQIADGVTAMLHRTDVVQDTIPDLDKYLRPGDLIKVEIKASSVPEYPISLEFKSLIARGPAWSNSPNSVATLFSLTDERRNGVAGGFRRDAVFRKTVIELYSHRCAACGKRLNVGRGLSAAEAAHIVARASRGVDDSANGICFCKVCHWAFDSGILAFADNGTIQISTRVDNETELGQSLRQMHGMLGYFPDGLELPREALAWHRRNVFETACALAQDGEV